MKRLKDFFYKVAFSVMKRQSNLVLFYDNLINNSCEKSEAYPFFLYLQKKGFKNIRYLTHNESAILKENNPFIISYSKKLFSKSTFAFLRARKLCFSFPVKDNRTDKIDKIFLEHGIIYEKTFTENLKLYLDV